MKTRIYILISIMLLVCIKAGAQEQKPMLQVADERFARNQYAAAIPLYKDLVRKKADKQTLRKLAFAYQSVNDYAAAAAVWMQITGLPDAESGDWIGFGEMLKCLARYEDAKAAFLKAGNDPAFRTGERIAGCDSALAWKALPEAYLVSNFEAANTDAADWGGVFYPGRAVVFTSTFQRYQMLDPKAKTVPYPDKRTMTPFAKIYAMDSARAHVVYGLAPAFNRHKFHTGPVTFSADYQMAYFTVTDVDRIHYTREKRGVRLGDRRLELFISKRENGQWQKAEAFAYNNPDSFSVGHAALSKDGQVLYFTSDMPGGYGSRDIWYCERLADGGWSAPRNCGPVINTPEQDDFPNINDGSGLYFSSKGHINMGGLDIFYANGAKDQWQTLRNMKSPVNSEGDDFCFAGSPDGYWLLSSNRPGGKGSDDIYNVIYNAPPEEPQPGITPLILQTIVVNEEGVQLPGASVRLIALPDSLAWTQLTDERGSTYHLAGGATKYDIAAALTGYTGNTAAVSLPEPRNADTVKVTIVLHRPQPGLRKGSTFTLRNIYYDFDKWNIREDASTDLDSLVNILLVHPTMKISLGSHTDCRGAAAYNQQLSQRRAESAVDYLVKNGIDRSRLVAKGYGESQLINNCDCMAGHVCSEAAHQANRRTEITILEE